MPVISAWEIGRIPASDLLPRCSEAEMLDISRAMGLTLWKKEFF